MYDHTDDTWFIYFETTVNQPNSLHHIASPAVALMEIIFQLCCPVLDQCKDCRMPKTNFDITKELILVLTVDFHRNTRYQNSVHANKRLKLM